MPALAPWDLWPVMVYLLACSEPVVLCGPVLPIGLWPVADDRGVETLTYRAMTG